MIGKVIGDKYVLLEKIGQGGSGSVYLARDLRLGKHWAIKVLEMGNGQEGAVLKSLEHSMIPRVVDCLEEQGKLWLVMDHISGKDLLELHRSGDLSGHRLLDLAIDLCQVLSYLHSLEPPYIHGDLKPENLIVTQEGKLFLVDFGAGAKRCRGICEGTPGYTAPEQEEGIVTCRSDIYSFGKTWQFLLGNNISRDWKRILEKCCQKFPEKRYQKIQDLEKCLRKMKNRQERRWMVLLLASALAVCAAAGYSAGNEEKDIQEVGKRKISTESATENRPQEKNGENGNALGGLAEALGQAAGIQEETTRERRLGEVLKELESFYKRDLQDAWKLRSGLLLAWGYRKTGSIAEAEDMYRELLTLYPDSGECYGSYGCMLLETGADKEKLQDLYEMGEQMVSDKDGHNYQIWVKQMEQMEG